MSERAHPRQALIFTALITLIPGIALSQATTSYQCVQGDLVRRIEIVAEPGVTVPCEVHYYKDTEAPGQDDVLWRAQSDPTWCGTRAEEFVAKLGGWGWNCAAADPAGIVSDEPADALLDDTVAPVDEALDDTGELEPVIDEVENDNS